MRQRGLGLLKWLVGCDCDTPFLESVGDRMGDVDASHLGVVGAGGGVWLREVVDDMIVAVPLSHSR